MLSKARRQKKVNFLFAPKIFTQPSQTQLILCRFSLYTFIYAILKAGDNDGKKRHFPIQGYFHDVNLKRSRLTLFEKGQRYRIYTIQQQTQWWPANPLPVSNVEFLTLYTFRVFLETLLKLFFKT